MEKNMNCVNGEWVEPQGMEFIDAVSPATGDKLARTPLCGKAEVEAAARAAAQALPAWCLPSAARKFRFEVEAGNIGINIGVAAVEFLLKSKLSWNAGRKP